MYKLLSLLVLVALAAFVLAEKQDMETAEQFYRVNGYYPSYYYNLVRGAGFPGYPGYSAYPAAAAAYPAYPAAAAAYPAYAAGYPSAYQYSSYYSYPYGSYGYQY